MLGVAIGFLALLALALCYVNLGLNSALAPLASLSTAVVFLMLFGVAGLLPAGAICLLFCSFALAGYSVVKTRGKIVRKCLKNVGFGLFLIFGIGALLWFGLRQPLFSQWDEFSFWGTVVKMMKLQGELYTTAEAGWFWTATEMPALPLLGWFVQFLSLEFAPWAVFFAYALLTFACVSAMMALAKNNTCASVSLAVIGILLPFIFLSPIRITSLSPAYLLAYGDLPAGLWFGGALAFYLSVRGKATSYWALLPLAGLTLVKDNTFSVALVAGGLMLCDAWFLCKKQEMRLAKLPRLELRWTFLAVPVFVYMLWRLHTNFANAQNVVMQGESTGASPLAAVQTSLLQLFYIQPRSAELESSLSTMIDYFLYGDPFTMLGNAGQNTLFILGIFALALLFSGGRARRLQVLLWSVLSTLGFLGFQFVLLTYYAFLNTYNGGVSDYIRYQRSYFAGWLMLALCLLSQCVQENDLIEKAIEKTRKIKMASLAAQTVVVLLGFGSMFLFAANILDGYSVLDFPESRYDILRDEQAQTEMLADEIEAGSGIFYINQGDTGLGWFKTHYYLLPHVLDYSFGGGPIVPSESGLNGEIVLSIEELSDYLTEHDLEYIYIDEIDESFIQNYGLLFGDTLHMASNMPMLYQRTPTGIYLPVNEA